MKIVRYVAPSGGSAFAELLPGDRYARLDGNPLSGFQPTGEVVEIGKLLAPVEPRAILCIGLNYRQHAAETDSAIPTVPVLFMKSLNTLQHPGGPIVLPRFLRSDKVDYECELAVVIGRDCRNIRREEALDHVAGYTCANDVSARDWQKEGGTQWCRGKGFDTFAPMGPCLVTPDEIPDPGKLRIRTLVNGEVLQDCTTADMIFDVASLIEFLSASTTLLAGTVILTGTPHGVGMARKPPRFLQAGDTVVVEIEGIGSLENPVVEEKVERQSTFRLPG